MSGSRIVRHERPSPATGGDRGVVLGVDIGGTKLSAGVVDPAGTPLSFVTVPTGRGRDHIAGSLVELAWRAVRAAAVDPDRIGAVGVGCGGPLDLGGGTVSPVNIPDLVGFPVVTVLAGQFDRPVALDNDAQAALLAEHRHGAGVGRQHLVYMTVSTGVGSAVLAGGRLLRGSTGNAAEFGHVVVQTDGRRCRCGQRGCLEAYASGTAIAERAADAARSTPGSALTRHVPLTAAAVADEAARGDPVAAGIWSETTTMLGRGLVVVVHTVEPEAIVLGGGVVATGEHLLGPAREYVRAHAIVPGAAGCRIVSGALGRRAGVVGAAELAQDLLATAGRVDG